MKRSSIAVTLLGAVLGVVVLSACGRGDPKSVHIDSIAPNSATFGDEIVIKGSGFSREFNTIGFGPLADGSEAYMNAISSSDTHTLRFELQEVMGVCGPAFPPRGDAPCILLGVTPPLGELQVSVSNEHGISNSLEFRREITHAESAEIAVSESPEYKRLTENLDRWIEDFFVPVSPSEFALASYGFTIGGQDTGNLYVELALHNIDAAAVVIPDEIEGYEVRVNATSVIASSD